MKPVKEFFVPLAIVKDINKVLLVLKAESSFAACRNKWEIPGGLLHENLSYDESLKKKMVEYLGVEIEIIKTIPKIVVYESDEGGYIARFYLVPSLCKLKSDKINLGKKLSDYNWFAFEEATQMSKEGKLPKEDVEILNFVFES